MNNYNIALKVVVNFLEISTDHLVKILQPLGANGHFTVSKIESWFAAENDSEYSPMSEAECASLCAGIYWLANGNSILPSNTPKVDSWSDIIDFLFDAILPLSVRSVVGEIIRKDITKSNPLSEQYTSALVQFSTVYKRLSNRAGESSEEESDEYEALIGFLNMACETGNRIPGSIFRSETLENWSVQISSELEKNSLNCASRITEKDLKLYSHEDKHSIH